MAKRRVTSCAVVPRGSKVQVCVRRSGEPGPQIAGPDDACRILRGAANADRESFMTLYLDAKNRVVGVDESHKGTLTGVDVHPREIFKGAIATNAASVIVAHNHPSGSATPSNEDLALTKRLAMAGKMIGIPVLDHVIVATDGCTSISEQHQELLGRHRRRRLYPVPSPDTGVTTIAGAKSCPYAPRFRRLVNMSPAAIRRWHKNPRSKRASYASTRARLPALARLKAKPTSTWSAKDCAFAKRVVAFNTRMDGMRKKHGCTDKIDVALRNWGRNACR